MAKARTHDSMQAFAKLTHLVDGEPRIISDPPLIVPVEELASESAADVTGMRATAACCQERGRAGGGGGGGEGGALLAGAGSAVMQIKEAQASVLEEFTGKSGYADHGERVVAGQHLMQAASDILLGWRRWTGDGVERDFYVRQLKDWKESANVEAMTPEGMAIYGRMCGWTLASAHARSGDRIAIAAYLGGSDAFDRALSEFAEAYADQNERDYAALTDAVASGRLTAETGL